MMPKDIYTQEIFNPAWELVKNKFPTKIRPTMKKNALSSLWSMFNNRNPATANQRLLKTLQNPTSLSTAISSARNMILSMSSDVIN